MRSSLPEVKTCLPKAREAELLQARVAEYAELLNRVSWQAELLNHQCCWIADEGLLGGLTVVGWLTAETALSGFTSIW